MWNEFRVITFLSYTMIRTCLVMYSFLKRTAILAIEIIAVIVIENRYARRIIGRKCNISP